MTNEEKPESTVLSAEEIADLKPLAMQIEPIKFDELLYNMRQIGVHEVSNNPWMPLVWRLAEEIQELKERLDS